MAKDKTPRDAAGTKAANEAMDAIIHDDNDDNGAAAEAEKQGAENETPEQQDCGDVTLSREEIEKLALEQQNTEVCCHFCNKKYVFSTDEMLNLLKE